MALSVGLGDSRSARHQRHGGDQTGGGGYVANPDVPLAELVDFDSLLIEADVRGQADAIKIDAPCEVVARCRADRRMRAVVVRGQPQAQSRQGPEYGESKSSTGRRRASRDERARQLLDKRSSANQLAQAAKRSSPLRHRGARGNKVVFTVDGDRVRIQPVQLGRHLPTASS